MSITSRDQPYYHRKLADPPENHLKLIAGTFGEQMLLSEIVHYRKADQRTLQDALEYLFNSNESLTMR